MNFRIDEVLADMVKAMEDSVGEDVSDIAEYARKILENEKESLAELARARIDENIDEEDFGREIEREMKVVEAELLTIKIMTKAAAEQAINAAVNVFLDAVNRIL